MPTNESTAQYVAVSVLKLMHKKGQDHEEPTFGKSWREKELDQAAEVDQS